MHAASFAQHLRLPAQLLKFLLRGAMLQKLKNANMQEWSCSRSNGFRIVRFQGSWRWEFDLVILEGSLRGFVIQARKSNERGSLVLGEFAPGSDDSTRTHTCSGHENGAGFE
ncbi:uncharacterized protein LOC119433002 [Dermacentor silvarum]|uniref:uncharacterized protein LOC119433002 n=1 Tax=Dermacentor silvarum TaxID=543639 RepID=UPI00210104CA|nr:uncharacterized protein LOC119433002 [Dermacentor silvarum]